MSIFEAAIGWVAPAQCLACGLESQTLCLGCSTSEIVPHGQKCYKCGRMSLSSRTCPSCRPSSPRHVWITTDYDGLAQKLIQSYKFGHQRPAAVVLTRLMAETLLDFNLPGDIVRLNYLIVPVPSATSRIRQRGFDHSALLATKLAKRINLQSINGLGRLGQNRQLGARRDKRLKQPKDNYYVRLPELIRNRNILLIDDVVTTGATLQAVTKVLRRAGARRIDALVFAKRL